MRADDEWIDAAAKYVRLHSGERIHFVRETSKSFETRLTPGRFVRVHRSIVVKLDFIQRLESREHGEDVITVRDGSKIRSSRTCNEALRSILRG